MYSTCSHIICWLMIILLITYPLLGWSQTETSRTPFFIVENGTQTSNVKMNHSPSTSTKKQKTQKTTSSQTASFPQKIPASGKNVFIFEPKKTSWAAYNHEGELIKTGKASGGKRYCADIRRGCKTPSGQFSIYAKRGASCKSSKFPVGRGGAPMPYCSFFHGGFAIHGSNHVPNYNASHGCIRVIPSAAKWLQEFLHYGATVIVRPY
jgi:lipoprotein-anchoring transpeptidase ErfK/SrfK